MAPEELNAVGRNSERSAWKKTEDATAIKGRRAEHRDGERQQTWRSTHAKADAEMKKKSLRLDSADVRKAKWSPGGCAAVGYAAVAARTAARAANIFACFFSFWVGSSKMSRYPPFSEEGGPF